TAALQAGDVDAVLHFSRRSAENYIAGGRQAGIIEQALAVRHFFLARPIAEPLSGAGAGSIAVAKQPDEAALIGLLEPAKG
ncbi:MAG: uroporphyrinogen-III synthase, partial [Hyphomicrobiales bacterium]